MALHYSKHRWQDQVILLLGLWLFISPWALGYASGAPISLNVSITGAVIALMAAFDLFKTYAWAVVVSLLAGVWAAVSPWAPALADSGALMTSNVIAGVAVVVLALWELRSDPDLHRQIAGVSHG
jgi:hypothetical protein